MLEKAKAAFDRFNELTDEMSDPATAADGEALGRIGKERARLEPLANQYAHVMQPHAAPAGSAQRTG
jgi:protein subunit release factor A